VPRRRVAASVPQREAEGNEQRKRKTRRMPKSAMAELTAFSSMGQAQRWYNNVLENNRMHLVYFDESGNSGTNLHDSEQPIFVLGALIVPEACWQAVEKDLENAVRVHFPELADAGAEIHAGDLRGSRGHFKGLPIDKRVGLRNDWLAIAQKHSLKFVYRSIEKRRFHQWLHETFGVGVSINPHIAAFPLVAMVVNRFLENAPALGMFISDENKEIVRDVEKSIRQLRLTSGPLRLSQVIEKGFFIDSAKSRILQLCDMCVLHARKHEEAKTNLGATTKPIDTEGIVLIQPLVIRGKEQLGDVLAWLKEEQQKAGKK
jgi:hypothetical protein